MPSAGFHQRGQFNWGGNEVLSRAHVTERSIDTAGRKLLPGHDGLSGGYYQSLLTVLWQTFGAGHWVLSRKNTSRKIDIPQAVQQTPDAIVERLVLLHRIVEHSAKAGEGANGIVSKTPVF